MNDFDTFLIIFFMQYSLPFLSLGSLLSQTMVPWRIKLEKTFFKFYMHFLKYICISKCSFFHKENYWLIFEHDQYLVYCSAKFCVHTAVGNELRIDFSNTISSRKWGELGQSKKQLKQTFSSKTNVSNP